ncbi:thiol-disulfide oxidoreductase DCC family protein [Marivita sp.]|uniref:thiol-disulfide oxidoreductase DCC family protein n=1 Tax=Marivita sp. TaxID=2003365 RepID=UPI003F6B01D1
MTERSHTKVLFNDDCPVCSFEINHYATYAKKHGLPIQFDDLNGPERAAWGIDEDTAARRLYVQRDGQLYDGIPAFLELWREMPRYRLLAKVVGLPGIKQLAAFSYDRALAPLIYRWHLRRKARAASQSG